MNTLRRQLRSGDWKSLLACFLYFDTGFTVWVMYGPLAQSITLDLGLMPSQTAFLTAVPILAAALLRVTFGNLYQAVDGRSLALVGILLSSIPPAVLLLMPGTPSLSLLLVLGVLLGMGGASFAVAMPMAGSGFPPNVQGLVLGLAAAGNIGAVMDGFLLPRVAEYVGWQRSMAASLPLLAIAAAALLLWGRDHAPKSGSALRAAAAFGFSLVALMLLVLAIDADLLGLGGRSGMLLLPVVGSLLMVAVLPARCRAVFARRDTWAVMLVYAVTFGGFVGMSSYVSPLLIDLYGISQVEAGVWMGMLALTGALVRPVGGWLADRVSGVRALLVVLALIAGCDLLFAALEPGLQLGIGLLLALYLLFGIGNGATFQLVSLRWAGTTGLMSGVIGAAGGIGGFYLPMALGTAREAFGGYSVGFALFGGISAAAWLVVFVLRRQWLRWAAPAAAEAESPSLAGAESA
ncbi:MFS transporter [Luteimonas sp. SJ-92]|uniref:MFS transporter n=1 Tax=Luteimonas salinisoli TaxID=2752307 RepID=A0A853JCD2_9GAMM|nr:MFS transporter [Luteimonas salinisoli]NZA26268.1 MFS transporter [Luteimonas salinisoli]